MKKKEALRDSIISINNITNDIILLYPYIDIRDEGLKYGNKNVFRRDIEILSSIRQKLIDVLMDEIDKQGGVEDGLL